MTSRLKGANEGYEGLIVVGRAVLNEYDSPERIEAFADAVNAWGEKLSLPLGLVYCGTTGNWPDGVQYTPIVIGLVTFSGFGDDDQPIAGEVGPHEMDVRRAEAIPAEFWSSLAETFGATLPPMDEVYLAVAGWAWARLGPPDGDAVCGASAEDDGYIAVPEKLREGQWTVRVGYC